MKFEDTPQLVAPTSGTRPCDACVWRRSSPFTPVTDEELESIESFRLGARNLPAGASIIDEHRPSALLFTLYSGWAFRFKTLSDGRRQILNFMLPGDFMGLQDEFADGHTYGVEALTAVSLCTFARERLWDLFHGQPKLGYDVTWLAAREENIIDNNLVTAGRRSASERVAMLLMQLYRRADRLGLVHEGVLDFPLNQQHIADALGLSLVHTNRTLRALQRLNLHELEGGRLRIIDAHALEHLGDYFERPLSPTPLI